MRTATITTNQFLSGSYVAQNRQVTRHDYTARWQDGDGILLSLHGETVPAKLVTFGGTANNSTCYCHVEGVGFIGGWTGKKHPWRKLVDSINRGMLYPSTSQLPRDVGQARKGNRLTDAANRVVNYRHQAGLDNAIEELELALRAAGYRV